MLTSQEQKPAIPVKLNRNLIILIAGVGVVLFSIITLIVLAIKFLAPAGGDNIGITPMVTKPPVTNTVTPAPTKVTINNKARITLKVDAAGLTPGSIWDVNPADLSREQLLAEVKFSKLFGWSPDNSYLAAVYKENQGYFVAVWEKAGSKLLKSNISFKEGDTVSWLNNKELMVFKAGQSSSSELFRLTLPEMTVKNENISAGIMMAVAKAAPDYQKIIFYEPGAPQEPILLLREAGRQIRLKNSGMVANAETDSGIWLNNRDYVYFSNYALYQLDTELMNISMIATLRSAELTPINKAGMLLSRNGQSLYFIFESKLYRFRTENKVTNELYDLRILLGDGDQVKLKVSPNEQYVIFTLKERSYLLDLKTNKMQGLCESVCSEAVMEQ